MLREECRRFTKGKKPKGAAETLVTEIWDEKSGYVARDCSVEGVEEKSKTGGGQDDSRCGKGSKEEWSSYWVTDGAESLINSSQESEMIHSHTWPPASGTRILSFTYHTSAICISNRIS